MKKLYTLFVLVVSFLCNASIAQTPTCNAEFTFTIQNGNTFNFVPVVKGDSANTHHYWIFGNGSTSYSVSPTYSYPAPGTFTVSHIIERHTNSGVLCRDSSARVITIQNFCNLTAAFSIHQLSPNTYHFQNNSINLSSSDSIRWTFGDGTSSNAVSPDHTYSQPGNYKICLRIQKRNSVGVASDCVREKCESVLVQSTTNCTLVASFQAERMGSATNALVYHFNNTSSGLSNTDSTRWTFGDGSSSNLINPTHTYTQAGTYNVCLRIIKRNPNGVLTNCVGEICKVVVVTNPNTCPLVAGFTFTNISVFAFHFQNSSTPINNSDSIRWTFGDGTTSNAINPDHSYALPGTYKVCLRIQKRSANGSLENCVREICHTVTVINPCVTNATFTLKVDSLNHKKIFFKNTTVLTSTAVVATWTFGDGTTGSGLSVVHEYAKPGRYFVCLRIQSANNCVSEKCDSITVKDNDANCRRISQFNFTATASNKKLFHFSPAIVNATWLYTWTFGDGTGSHDINATHEYAKAGTYTVCLTVFKSSDCASTTCKVITVTTPAKCDGVTASYNYQRDPVIPNKIYFHAVANRAIIMQTWIIKKINGGNTTPLITIHQNNPVYQFADTGVYRVCLVAITEGICVKEYCREIHIGHIPNPTTCVLQPFPNPANTVINMNVMLGTPQMMNVYIYNTLNILVKEKHQQGYAGNNLVSLNINDLLPGTYSIKLIHGNDVCHAQFIKL